MRSPYDDLYVDRPSRLESGLEKFFYDEVQTRLGGMSVKLAPIIKGMPDRLIILPGGRMYLVELKTETGTLSPMQRQVHRRLFSLGIQVDTLYGRQSIREWCIARCKDYDAILDAEEKRKRERAKARRKRAKERAQSDSKAGATT